GPFAMLKSCQSPERPYPKNARSVRRLALDQTMIIDGIVGQTGAFVEQSPFAVFQPRKPPGCPYPQYSPSVFISRLQQPLHSIVGQSRFRVIDSPFALLKSCKSSICPYP